MGDNTPTWARQGAKAAEKQAEKQAANAGSGKFTPEFYLSKKRTSAVIRVLNFADVITVQAHSCQIDGYWKQLTCPGKSKCPFCEVGHTRQPRFFVNVIDRSEREYKGKTYKNEIKMWMFTSKIFEDLKKIDGKFGLDDYDLDISRTGTNTKTKYTLLPDEQVELTAEEENAERVDIYEVIQPKTHAELKALAPDPVAEEEESGAQDTDADW